MTAAKLPVAPRTLSLALVLVLALMMGCSDDKTGEAPDMQASVKIAQPLIQQTIEWDDYTGRIEAVDSVDIRARVGGHLESVHFTAGARVNKGDLLFVIDPRPYQAQLNLARAELERAKIRRELAKNDLARAENLHAARAMSAEDYDARQKGLREAAAAVASASAQVDAAKLDLDYSEIRAPISGRIGRAMVTPGNLVGIGIDASVLATLVSIDPVHVYIDVDEQSVLRYRRRAHQLNPKSHDLTGTPMQLAIADETDFPHQGHIDYLSPRENPDTGTVTLRGVFANPEQWLIPGFFARVRIRASEPYPALLLPERVLITDQTLRFVWVLKADGQLDYRHIVPGPRIGNLRVIREGLAADDWVVVVGGQKLKAAMPVKPEKITLDAAGTP
ncbi:MAG: efflux RND transporter periplasmic adaptor subunit [Methylomonas sp.]|nr:efflux RND transporter periplasmic adaptor subunit [Methylomonas sp.]PPD20549.1 MAG: efflux transporter periplasmic adaptor subunit [Methylomonas sp.]PPD26563.1 MAG: efflux transporter periplasmic adaptor subunit [Methylomonas sp.]PPD38358.1 MAG: efflux transporter periplasmic adaptor subunit [Methylomonas sp.]PPD42850.1 MAG: efflux transporter periplasmic adaptor subunit [Methylomonas sp.]